MSYEKPNWYNRMSKDQKLKWHEKALDMAIAEIDVLRSEIEIRTPERSDSTDLAVALGLTMRQAEFLSILYSLNGRPVNDQMFFLRLPSRHKPVDDLLLSCNVKVHACNVKKKLPEGSVRVLHGRGYYLTPIGMDFVGAIINTQHSEAAE